MVLPLLVVSALGLSACTNGPVMVLDTQDSAPVDSDPTVEPEALVICINEFMPANVTGPTYEDGFTPDWIELHNPGPDGLVLRDWTLSDDLDEPDKATLSADLILAAGDFLLLWADEQPELGPEHLPFRLDAQGGDVVLMNPDGVGSAVRYGEVADDLAAARKPDCCAGEECWQYELAGTPGSTNTPLIPEDIELIEAGSTWRYLDGGADAGDDWAAPDFNDSSWAEGPGPLGYGDSHQVTVLDYGGDSGDKAITYYMRHSFTVEGAARFVSLDAGLMRDDGAVVYLNGEQIIRSNMPAGDIKPNTPAAGTAGNDEETNYLLYPLDPGDLVEGLNVIAAEVHQANTTSSDLSYDLELAGERLPEGR